MDRYTIRDYEEFLRAENELHDIPGNSVQIVAESQGIVEDYSKIIDGLYEVASKQESIPYDKDYSYLMYSIGYYKMKENCFISDLTFYVFAGDKGQKFEGSQFKQKQTTHITKSYKLSDFYIFIGIDDNDIRSEKGRKEFYTELAHELQHAYRCYCILLTNDEDVEKWERISKERYARSIAMYNAKDEIQIRKHVSRLYYLSEKDEISSERNRLFEYIRQHEEINSNNYQEHLDNMPLYNMAKEFTEFSKMLKRNKDNEYFVTFVGKLFEKIRGVNGKTTKQSYADFITRLSISGTYALRKFYTTLHNAFVKFNRMVPRNINRNLNENFYGIDIMKEINKIKMNLSI